MQRGLWLYCIWRLCKEVIGYIVYEGYANRSLVILYMEFVQRGC